MLSIQSTRIGHPEVKGYARVVAKLKSEISKVDTSEEQVYKDNWDDLILKGKG